MHGGGTMSVRHQPRNLYEGARATGAAFPVQPGSALRRDANWQRNYVRTIIATDAGAAALSAALAFGIRFGGERTTPQVLLYLVSIVVMPALWVLAMTLCRTYEVRFHGVGSDEFRRVSEAGMVVIAGVATTSYAFRLELARGFVVLALPLALALTLLGRYLARKTLHSRRIRGGCVQQVVAVGHVAAVAGLVRQLRSHAYHGMTVTVACVPSGRQDPVLTELGVRVIGTFEEIPAAVLESDVDAVAVLPSPELDGSALRRLGWQLEATRAELLVAPAVMEVVGPRIAIRPICGLPLLHVERPEFTGVRRAVKNVFDRCAASVGLLALLPVLLVLTVAVKTTSPGPALFRQTRIGRNGQPFSIYKLRTMHHRAELRVVELNAANEGNGVLFKIHADPRVTSVGKWLRRYSLDELPQLGNVLLGHMSLVGPRPPLASEVEAYGDDMRRRLLVKPGLTGLWQINGRSDLDWDEAVRLDLRYVENWSFAFDLMIIWKTAAAVLRGRGAY